MVIVLVLFGSTRLPKLARSMGEASKEFKKGVEESSDQPAALDPNEPVTMSRAELEALLAKRESEARAAPPAAASPPSPDAPPPV